MNRQLFSFYTDLEAVHDFALMGERQRFVSVPDGWSILISDIRGSTKAIEAGRYKEVNLVGAAAIACYVNLAGSHEIPFVFGGDGATLLVPNNLLAELAARLKALRDLALSKFKIDMRIGAVDVSVLRGLGQDLRIAKYELSKGNCLAQFAGGAIDLAEKLVKANDVRALFFENESGKSDAEIQGLSCRLEPLKSVNGKILTLLCKAKNEAQASETYRRVLSQLTQILNQDLKSARPVRGQNLRWPILPRKSGLETQINSNRWPKVLAFVHTYLFALVSNYSLRNQIRMGQFSPETYKAELELNSDFKKFDDTLRMVLDCTGQQVEQIHTLLEEMRVQGLLYYGTQVSDEALMTCMVLSPTSNQHIHFIDGSGGGYAMAALQLKAQISGGGASSGAKSQASAH